MDKNKKLTYNIIFKNAIRCLAIISCFIYFINTEHDNAMGGVLFLITSLGVDIILKLIKINLTNIIDFILHGFIILCLLLGKMYNIYGILPWWDLFLHFISGILVGIAGLLLLRFSNSEECFNNFTPFFKATYAFIMSIASSAVWEAIEFVGDQTLGMDSQLNSLTDTMSDICICIVGGLIISVIIYLFYKKDKFKFIGKTVESFSRKNSI